VTRVWHSDKVSAAYPADHVRNPTGVAASRYSRTRYWWEIGLVLGLTVGRSALYSVLSLIRTLAESGSLAGQETQINQPQDAAAFWDITYQVLGWGFGLMGVALAIFLLWEPADNALHRIGLDFRHFGHDILRALLVAAVIGIPGLGLYALGRALELTVAVRASPLDPSWWTIPLLLLAAVRAGLTEEVIFIAFLFDRLRRLGWGWWTIILSTALLRGAYHAYQGYGAIVGNVAMGIVFGWCYRRWGRIMPLVIAHTLLDVVAFVGYPLAAALWPDVFAPPALPSPSPSPTPTESPTPVA